MKKRNSFWRCTLGCAVLLSLAFAGCKSNSTSDSYVASTYYGPSYIDNYVSIASFSSRSKWNLANTHDPTVFKWTDGYYYMFGTDASYGNAHEDYTSGGAHFQGKRSKNLIDWEWVPGIMDEAPDWILTKVNAYRSEMGLTEFSSKDDISWGFWAPTARVVTVDGVTKVRMYYSIVLDNYIKTGAANTTANFDGSWTERAFIGVAESTNPNGGASAWEDKGFVVCSSSDRGTEYTRSSTSDWNGYFYFNAIDPSYFIDDDDTHWLVYGSWHSGFALVRINPETGKVAAVTGSDYLTGTVTGDFEMGYPWAPNGSIANPKPEELITQGYGTRIFSRGTTRWQPSEGPELIKANGYYWLFFANDGLEFPYQTRVVRATSIQGPYYDITGDETTNDVTPKTNSSTNIYPIVTHPYKFVDADNGLGSCYGWVGISHCALFQDDDGDWYYMSQQRLPSDAGGNEYSNAIMMGGIRKIVWAPSGDGSDTWPLALPERYGGIPSSYGAVSKAEIIGTWQHINLKYNYATTNSTMDVASTLTLNLDGSMTGALSGTWSFSKSAQQLTLTPSNGTEVTVVVAREIDWEKNPRVSTIVYAGTQKSLNATYWGKKETSTESLWTTTDTSATYEGDNPVGVVIPELAATTDEGFTLEFTMNDSLSSYLDAWAAKLLSYNACYVTVPYLDPWWNSISDSNLTEHNAYAGKNDASVLSSGYDATFAWESECTIKVTFSSSEIKWYKDGELALTYSEGAFGETDDIAEFVGYYVTGLQEGAVVLNEGCINISNVKITLGIN